MPDPITWHSRADWGARARKPHPNFTPADVRGVALHWPGADLDKDVLAGDPDAVAASLRSEQKLHMDGRGHSDIDYNAAVDQSGAGWKLRWLKVRSGANDESKLPNERYLAITMFLNKGDKPSDAMIATVRDFVSKVVALYPTASEVVPHSDLSTDGTECPGDVVRDAIDAGTFTEGIVKTNPKTTAPPMTPEDDMNLDDRVKITNAVAKEAFPDLPSITVGGLLQYAAAYSRDAARDAAIARALAERSAAAGRALSKKEIDSITAAAIKALNKPAVHAVGK